MCKMYEIDPDGDLIIIHHKPKEAFAVWDNKKDSTNSPQDDVQVKKIGESQQEGSDSSGSPSPALESQFKVSSKHLTLASRRFRKMLSGDWLEANTIYPDGHRHVTLEAFDPDALLILLNILHGKTRKVPRSVDLEMLAKISVIVDDFECHEEVEIFSDEWIRTLKDWLPTDYNRDLVLWILISIVFHKHAEFKRATHTAILHNEGLMKTLDLPIPGVVIDKIEQNRTAFLDQLFSMLNSLINDLCKPDRCSFECRSAQLGALTMQMKKYGLFPSRSDDSLFGYSFAHVSQSLRSFEVPQSHPLCPGCRNTQKKLYRAVYAREFQETYKCNLRESLNPALARLEERISGLDLDDYVL
ncbi:hypothetical protein VM1G_06263 [Cytospora mali]|uniref:BTB domain-containing protein n=1 Tax=Cytospora mali TaxID=578113 RepID=A0A194W2X3_CYTMA|nr:hypothetical protein VM1G_06263 [Valsa mali]